MMRFLIVAVAAVAAMTASARAQTDSARSIAFGTFLNPDSAMAQARRLAQSLANPQSPQWRAKGDQRRSYRFEAANTTAPYRIVIPPAWDGASPLPMLVFLHSGFGTENTNLDANNGQLVTLAIQHGYALVSPLGHTGAYGNHLRLPAVFGQQASADQQVAAVTANAERTNQLSEQDVLNVIEIVLREYPIDRGRMFLTGHSMGAGGTWYLGAKYPGYWAALATLSGPFVHVAGYPWENIRPLPHFLTEGNNTAGTASSRALHTYMVQQGFDVSFKEVVADHEGMIPLVLPDVFAFFNENPRITAISPRRHSTRGTPGFRAKVLGDGALRITLPPSHRATSARVSLFDAAGKNVMSGVLPASGDAVVVNDLALPRGAYQARVVTEAGAGAATFLLLR